jgi:hypothetical protein
MRPRESAVVWVLATPSSHGAAVRVRRGKLKSGYSGLRCWKLKVAFVARVVGL